MGNAYRATHQIGNGKDLEQLLRGHPDFMAGAQMIADAVVAPEHHTGHEAEQFFGFHVECAIGISGFVEGKKAVEGLVFLGEDFVVHLRSVIIECFDL